MDALESLRGVAALMVVGYHLAELLHIPVPDKLGFVKTHFGLGVPLFYVLSGFVLSHGYQHRLDHREQVRSFFVRRLFRIAPLFYAVVATWMAVSYAVWKKVFTSQTLFLNVTFLFGLVPGEHESIAWAGWSIGVEMLFYALFPVLSVWATDSRRSWALFAGALVLSAAVQNKLLGLSLGSYAYMNLGTQLPFFLAGVACSRTWADLGYPRSPRASLLLFVGSLSAAASMVFWPPAWKFLYDIPMGNLEHNAWTIIFGALVLAACSGRVPLLDMAPFRRLGKLSFSLYLVHPLVMLAMIKWDLAGRLAQAGWSTGVQFLSAGALVTGLVWAVSELTFRFIELPGMELGRRLTQPPTRGETAPFETPRA